MQSELKKDEIIVEVVCAGPKNYASFSMVSKSFILQVLRALPERKNPYLNRNTHREIIDRYIYIYTHTHTHAHGGGCLAYIHVKPTAIFYVTVL